MFPKVSPEQVRTKQVALRDCIIITNMSDAVIGSDGIPCPISDHNSISDIMN